MRIEQFGGALLVAVVVALWMLYLIPGWIERRRERGPRLRTKTAVKAALAADAHVERLANEELEARKLVETAREQERQVRLARRHEQRVGKLMNTDIQAARRRRGRLTASAVLLIGIGGIVAGGMLVTSTRWGLLALVGGGVLVAGSIAMLNAVARVAATQRERVYVVDDTFVDHQVGEPAEGDTERAVGEAARPQAEDAVRDRSWTPVPVPAPLYLTHAQLLEAARAEAERAEAAEAPESDVVASEKGVAEEIVAEESLAEQPAASAAGEQLTEDLSEQVARELEHAKAELEAASEESVQALREAAKAEEVASIDEAASAPEKGYAWLEELERSREGLADDDLDEVIRRRRDVG